MLGILFLSFRMEIRAHNNTHVPLPLELFMCVHRHRVVAINISAGVRIAFRTVRLMYPQKQISQYQMFYIIPPTWRTSVYLMENSLHGSWIGFMRIWRYVSFIRSKNMFEAPLMLS